MAARELRLLRILGLEDVTDAIEQLDVALLPVLLERRDEGPRHGTRGLRCDGGVGAVHGPIRQPVQYLTAANTRTHEV